MLHQTLPGVPQAVDDARAWIKTALLARYPSISVDDAVQVAGELVAAAVRHTPNDGVVQINLKPSKSGLIIEVRDPNSPASEPHDSAWADVSRVVRNFGSSSSTNGHVTWCELPEKVPPR